MPDASSLAFLPPVCVLLASEVQSHLQGCHVCEPLREDIHILEILNDIQTWGHLLHRNSATTDQTGITGLIAKGLVDLAVLDLAARGGSEWNPYICRYLEKLAMLKADWEAAAERKCDELNLALNAALFQPKESTEDRVYPGGHSVSIVLTTNYHDPDENNQRLEFGSRPPSSVVDQTIPHHEPGAWHKALWRNAERVRSWAYTGGPSATSMTLSEGFGPQSPFGPYFHHIAYGLSEGPPSENSG